MSNFFSTEQKLSLARSLISKASPAYVQYYITARCNLACEQCNIIYAHSDANEMNLEQIKLSARNLKKIGVCIVLLIGGEPFVRKDLPQIIKCFTDEGIHVRMQTNGLATRQALEECIQNGGHDISISLDSLEDSLQEKINGDAPKSWGRAITTASVINEIFPPNGTAFFGTVLMPRNIFHIQDVVEFATEIGWGVSLVPAHITKKTSPMGFRTFDEMNVCRFQKEELPFIKNEIEELKVLKSKGYLLYDSDEYLDDINRFIAGDRLHWRDKNNGVCDSPNLYFAIEPNGNLSPCCDYKLVNSYPVYDDNFPDLYDSRKIHAEVEKYTKNCDGCLYGSYPEITVSSRNLMAAFQRYRYFQSTRPILKKISPEEMQKLARNIFEKNKFRRNERQRELDSRRKVLSKRILNIL